MVKTVTWRIILAGAWAAGLLAYILALEVVWHQSIAYGDLVGVVQLSLIAWAIAYGLVYLPLLLRLSRSISEPHRFWLLPVAALALSMVAVALVWLGLGVLAALLGFGWSSLSPTFFASPEASLFYWFFGVSSMVVGLGLACIRPRKTI
jgi:hypothetical protein